MRAKLLAGLIVLTIVSCKKETFSDIVAQAKLDTSLVSSQSWRISSMDAGYYNQNLKLDDISDFFVDGKVNIYTPQESVPFTDLWYIKSDSIFFQKLGSNNGSLGGGYYGWKIDKLNKLDFWISRKFSVRSVNYSYEIRFRVK